MSSSNSLETRFLEEADFDAWRRFVDSAPGGSIYSYPAYLDVLCRVAGGRFRILAVFKGEEIHGGIALYERDGLGGRILSGRLLLYYNGFVLRSFEGKYPSVNASRRIAILSALEQTLRRQRYDHVNVRSRHEVSDMRPFATRGWHLRPSYSLLMRFADPAEAFERIEQNQRRLIRRAESAGTTVGPDDDFPAFFHLHRTTHERKGAPLYLPEQAFQRYFAALSAQGLCRLYQARLKDGSPVASQLVLLGDHPVTHTVSAAADPKHLSLGITPYLRWRVCEALAADGYEGNDLTGATLGEVTRFKSQLGGQLVTNLVLRGEDHLRYRLTRAATEGYWRSRALVGRAIRSLLGQEEA